MTSYLMPAGFGEAEYVEKRSRFICRVWPVESEEQALSHIAEMRKKHYDARHNVYAYIIRENGIMRYSDDGEPSGTSGQPTLNVFRSQEIQNVCCVVTRYFGGILLGTGGLVRAYTAAAKMGLEAAGLCRMAEWREFTLECDYARFERIKRLLEDSKAVIEDTDFGAGVTFLGVLRADKTESFAAALREATAGAIECAFGDVSFRGVRI